MTSTYVWIYLSTISLMAIILTLYDKSAARMNNRRVKESTLLLVAALGGSVVMLATMGVIHHKTQHKKFMIGIPLIIALQIAVVMLFFWLIAKYAFI